MADIHALRRLFAQELGKQYKGGKAPTPRPQNIIQTIPAEEELPSEPPILEIVPTKPITCVEHRKLYWHQIWLLQKKRVLLPLGIALASLIACVAAFVFRMPLLAIPLALPMAIALIAMTVNRRIAWSYRKHYQEELDANTLVFYEDEMHILSANKKRSKIKHDIYDYAVETHLLFYMRMPNNSGCAFFLKQHMTPEQIIALRKLLGRKLGEKFKGMRK